MVTVMVTTTVFSQVLFHINMMPTASKTKVQANDCSEGDDGKMKHSQYMYYLAKVTFYKIAAVTSLQACLYGCHFVI